MEKRLIAILSVSLIAALLVIAFMAGRMSVQTNESAVRTAAVTGSGRPVEPPPAASPVSAPVSPPVLPPPVEQRQAPADKQQQPLPLSRAPEPQLPLRREDRAEAPHAAPQTGPAPAITSYFAKIDAIQVEGSGDPDVFAQAIIGGIEHGDSSQINKLVDDAKLALGKATSVSPPPACAEYHRRLIETLSESVAGLEKFRTAMLSNDLGSVASVAMDFQTVQQKVKGLDLMKKQLLQQ